jgi:nucleoid DNA-binding protein
MIKKGLIDAVVTKTAFDKKEVELILDAIISTIKKELIAKNEVRLQFFGTFKVKKRKPKICNLENLKGEIVGGGDMPYFQFSKRIKEKVNK